MSDKRQVWSTLARLLARLEALVSEALTPHQTDTTSVEDMQKEVRRLGKAQFKANVLAEEQSSRFDEAIEELKAQQVQTDEALESLIQERVASAKQDWLASLLPALDGLDNAINSGRKYLVQRDRAAQQPNLTPAQTVLVSPADRKMLAGWLEGLQLVRERLLDVLESNGVRAIPTVGHPFDPYQHVAVATRTNGADKAGIIVGEERRGYQTDSGVLRYAEVIVCRPQAGEADVRHN